MNTFRDDPRFDKFFFFKDQLEKQLRISLSNDDLNNILGNDNSNLPHAELEPYKSRITINSWEAACLIAYNYPDADCDDPMVEAFKNSILNAVKYDILSSTDCKYDANGELCYAEIYTKEVGQWAKKHNYNWPLNIDDDIKESLQNNSKLLQRINQLEQELAEQKKINDDFVVVPFYENSEEFLKAHQQGKNSPFNDDYFISLKELINTITEQYRLDISETARILSIIVRKYNISMYEYSLLSGVAPFSEEYNLKAKEILALLAEGICVATTINNENYRTSTEEWASFTHRFPLYDKIAINTTIIQDTINEEINKKQNNIILPSAQLIHNELQQELEQAKKEIDQLKNGMPQNLNNQPKKESPKTINAQSKFIKSLLYIHYGADVANNPRPHIENASGEIVKDFDAQGLSRELPSSLTVKKWVDSVELDMDS